MGGLRLLDDESGDVTVNPATATNNTNEVGWEVDRIPARPHAHRLVAVEGTP